MKDIIDQTNIPAHIAIILDGNGRWAKKRGLPRNLGHRKGSQNIQKIANECHKLGIKYLTVFAFSTENWLRPEKEVEFLMEAPIKYLEKNRERLIKSDLRIRFIGRRNNFSKDLIASIEEMEYLTKNHTGLQLNIALDYGAKNEIVLACQKITKMVLDKKIAIEEISEDLLEEQLFTAGMDKLDLLIRTSGEVRISNFLLWQLSYAELYFTDVYWPDFDKEELLKAIKDYQSRSRRFGKIKVGVSTE